LLRAEVNTPPPWCSNPGPGPIPLIDSMKKSLLARKGLRQRDLTWAGRELLDVYC
jgi:hypothetical protein